MHTKHNQLDQYSIFGKPLLNLTLIHWPIFYEIQCRILKCIGLHAFTLYTVGQQLTVNVSNINLLNIVD